MHKNVCKASAIVTALALAGAVAGCHKAATGQVAAVVNGDEISLQELNAEIGQAPPPPGADKNTVRAQALQRIVERRLIAQQAKAAGLDRDPDYLLRQRQIGEGLLIQFYAKKAQDTLRIPDTPTIDRFIATHPQVFADRKVYDVDQVRFQPPRDPAVVNALRPAHSMAAVVAVLKAKGVPFQDGTARIDSAQVPPAVLAQINALPPGEPFVSVTPRGAVVSVITKATPAPLSAVEGRPLAVQAIRNEELGKLLQQRLKDARASAKIEYQPGFAPPPGGGTPAAAGTSQS